MMKRTPEARDPGRTEAAALRAWERTFTLLALRLPAAGSLGADRRTRSPRPLLPLGGSRWKAGS